MFVSYLNPQCKSEALTTHGFVHSTQFTLVIQLPVILQSVTDLRPDKLGSLLTDVVLEACTKDNDVRVKSASVAEGKTGRCVACE